MKVSGSCLCDSVKFSFEAPKAEFGACHCSMCRKWGGGPAMAVQSIGEVSLEGEDHIKTYVSSDWAERGFCSKCGTHLFYRTKDQSFMNFNMGTISGHEEFSFTSQIFTDNKPGSYDFSNETHKMTEAEVLKAFGSNP